MKICLIGFNNLTYMPYLKTYQSLLEQWGCDLDIVYWDRSGLIEVNNAKRFAFTSPYCGSKLSKILGFYRFKQYAEEILRTEEYDFVIVLTTMPSVLLSEVLRTKYKRRYVIDIRDYTYEWFAPYHHKVQQLTELSALNVISSPFFTRFLPRAKYTICHNFDFNLLDDRDIRRRATRKNMPIRISYPGCISYWPQIYNLLGEIGNDERFVLKFMGPGAERVCTLCDRKGINNVSCGGAFDRLQKYELYQNTDFIFNLYGNRSMLTRYLLSNKLYDAAYFYIPLLVSPNTAVEEYSEGFGLTIDVSQKGIGQLLGDAYRKIDWDVLEMSCDRFINKCISENRSFEQKLLVVLNGGKSNDEH